MDRIALASLPEGVVQSSSGAVTPGASVYINTHGTTSQVTVYAAEVGNATLPLPVLTDAQGHIPGYVNEGQRLDITVTYQGTSTTVEANAVGGDTYTTTTALNAEIARAQAAEAAETTRAQSAEGAGGAPPVGTIADYGGTSDPNSNWLICDGRSVLKTSYPTLFNVLSTTYGSADGTHFNLPDCRGRTSVGAGQGTGLTNRVLAAKFGEENHPLITSELPVHNHPITDPGHGHTGSGGSHAHGVSDPGHTHTLYNTAHTHAVAADSGYPFCDADNPGTTFFAQPAAGGTVGAKAISNTSAYTNPNTTVAGAYSNSTGITINSASTTVTINAAVSGASVGNTGSGTAHNNVQPSLVLNKIIRAL